ncbi:PIG-L deacetylase family protein [Mycobacterium kiyosense]|uniref:PIG-L deacetylase family protein n=1 Tax=Mycobacterium kiyosense TaxID=2871094 RepID=UPI001F3ADE27|nr:PIG-L deacetylase family protein [Mycobacterium kiyosense]BDB41218.1 GlcNAc-PI de-N-acetylase [Mycobacterium kiyosense]GLB96695.1 GlcNAc-PI de-N-acetylase [Mycobacterium kiyosense]GLD08568.1 GlcNAc-PI de-N-acetylase [Mycobacterium kiyosense]GLD13741.1 GlcNAc-PI de-N-acetylase [Mycobacterium kiyosense]GLD19685.1 GlcNAc-PI de-N-acetylase [Mycobacterium kiyosense]
MASLEPQRDNPRTAVELEPLPHVFERTLVIVAHPDDAEYSFGGTVSRLAAEGVEVTYAICTDGRLGGDDPTMPGEKIGAIRESEQRNAAEYLGVGEVVFLGFPDGNLTASLPLRRELARQIRRYRPDLVLTHQPLRSLSFPIGASHPDHLAVGEAALAAVYPDARNPRAFPELLAEGLSAHRVTEVWVPGHEHTDLLIDVGPHAERKLQAILKHRSQFVGAGDPRAEISWVVERMRNNGRGISVDYAESFKRIVTDSHASAGPVPHIAEPAAHGSI